MSIVIDKKYLENKIQEAKEYMLSELSVKSLPELYFKFRLEFTSDNRTVRVMLEEDYLVSAHISGCGTFINTGYNFSNRELQLCMNDPEVQKSMDDFSTLVIQALRETNRVWKTTRKECPYYSEGSSQ